MFHHKHFTHFQNLFKLLYTPFVYLINNEIRKSQTGFSSSSAFSLFSGSFSTSFIDAGGDSFTGEDALLSSVGTLCNNGFQGMKCFVKKCSK